MGANQQMLLASAPRYTGVLDSYTSTLWGAYGLTRLVGAYGIRPAVRVRRSSDNATQDINLLANGTLDSTTLSAFVGASTGSVAIWYDQSGGGNNLVQATTTMQPLITNGSGTYLGNIQFNASSGSTHNLSTTNTSSSSVATKSLFRKLTPGTIVNGTIEWGYGDETAIGTAAGANQMQQAINTSPNDNVMYLATNSGAGYYAVTYNSLNEATSPVGIICKKGQGSPAASFVVYQGGGIITNTFSTTSGSVTTTGNFPGYGWTLGSPTVCARMNMYSVAIYDSDQSANANAINTALT